MTLNDVKGSRDSKPSQWNSTKKQTTTSGMDLYAVLEVNRNSTQDEIKQSFRRLALRYHPDKNPDDQGAAEKFKEINKAHAILSNDKKRQMYDRYGSFGLYLIENVDESDWRAAIAAQNPCVICLVITCFILSCCCCCFCCGRLLPRHHEGDFQSNDEEREFDHIESPSKPVYEQPNN